MICCQRDARTHRRQPTSVQYWWHFRAWSGLEGVPLGQLHSYSDHLAEHFGLLGMAENPNRSRRERMRLQDDFFPPHAAPRAGVTLASFYKVDRPLVFRTPYTFDDPVARFIHLDKTSRRQDGVHREILGPDVTVGEIAVGELGEIGDGNEAPLFNHATKIGGAAFVEARVHANWNSHRSEAGQSVGNVRFWRRN